MDQPLVYIILINYNGWYHTLCCIQSLLNMDYQYVRIVIVDNGSKDDSIDKIISWAEGRLKLQLNSQDQLKDLICKRQNISCDFTLINESQPIELKKINLIALNENLGFSGGNNKGIKIALSDSQCKYIWLLNNDTVVKNDSLSILINFANSQDNKMIGIIGSKLLYYDNPIIINGMGGRYHKCLGKPTQIFINKIDKGQEIKEIDYVIGASMFVRKEFIEDVGLMSEDYFLYYEELDWAIRAKKKDWLIKQCNDSIVYHKEGSTIGSNKRLNTKTATTDYYTQRNKILITKRYYPYCLPSVLIISIIACFLKTIRFGTVRMKILLKAIYHGLINKKGFYEGL